MKEMPRTFDDEIYVYWWPTIEEFVAYNTETTHNPDYIFVGKNRVQLDVPDDIDVTGQQIANLERQRDELRSEYGDKIDRIDRQIRELQALDHQPEESA